jgi:phosphate transport system permease protein
MTDVRDPLATQIPTATLTGPVVNAAGNGSGPDGAATNGAATRLPPNRVRVPRRPREMTTTDYAIMLGCFLSALSLCWLVFERLTGGAGWLGFGLAVWAAFLLLYFIVNADRLGATVAADRVMTAVVITGSIVMFIPLVFLIGYVIVKGLPALTAHFFFEDQRGVTPVQDATAGGAMHAMIGTIEQVGLALAWSLPLGLAAAVFLNESRSRWRRLVRIFVDAMSGLPSIIAGLFIYAVFILPYAKTIPLFSFNGFMASLALALVMLPTIIRTVEVVLRLVPDGLRESGLALGATRARTVWSVVLPTARSGITTALVLAVARGVGETAPLLFTAFGYDLMNSNPFSGPQESLPLFTYRNILKPDVSAVARGFAGALVLMFLVSTLFVVARLVGADRSSRKAHRSLRSRVKAPFQKRSSS